MIHRKENPVYNFAAIFGMYTFFEIYPILFKNELTDFWSLGYLGLTGVLIWVFFIPFQKKFQETNLLIHES